MNSNKTETAQTPGLSVPSAQHSGNGLQPLLSIRTAPAGLGASWPASSNHIDSGLERPRQESAHRVPGHRSHGVCLDPQARRTELALGSVFQSLKQSLGGAASGIFCRSLRTASQLQNLLVLPQSETDHPGQTEPLNRTKAAGNVTHGSVFLDSLREGGDRGRRRRASSQRLITMLISPFCSVPPVVPKLTLNRSRNRNRAAASGRTHSTPRKPTVFRVTPLPFFQPDSDLTVKLVPLMK